VLYFFFGGFIPELTSIENLSQLKKKEKTMNTYQSNRIKSVMVSLFILLGCLAFQATSASAAPGDLIKNVPLPVQGFGVSVAVDCEGNVYYTIDGDNDASGEKIYVMDKDGNLLNTIVLTDPAGEPFQDGIDEFAWDQSREILWSQIHASNPIVVVQIDPATGIVSPGFTSATNSVGIYRDGIAYDGTDDTLWISGDVSSTIEHYQADGTYLGQITPTNAAGETLGTISGVLVGVGDLLYLGRNGLTQIVQVKKSDGSFIATFASPGGARDEGLECDPVDFADVGLLALWSRDVNNFMSVIELEPDTCLCGGVIRVPADIKPGSCPNPLNTKARGVLPVAILGTDDFDVNTIDISTIQLEGVAPIKVNGVFDVSQPFIGELADCYSCVSGDDLLDGLDDLVLKFDTQEVVAALGEVTNGDCLIVKITGALLDGSLFEAEDIIRIQK